MNFRDDLARQVIDGTKTVTRRLLSDNPASPWWRERCAYRIGQSVAICTGRGKPQIGRATITNVARVPLGQISLAEARAEGFASVPEFVAAWTAINGDYDPAAGKAARRLDTRIDGPDRRPGEGTGTRRRRGRAATRR